MLKIIYIILLSFILSNCNLKPVVKHHGVPFLEKKQASLKLNESNTNDIKNILGFPSTKSKFDNDIWIYIERKQTQSKIVNLGKLKISKNNVLVLEIDQFGILRKKDFYNINDMKNLKFDNQRSESLKKRNFVYNFLSSLRQRVNDPMGVRKKKREQGSR